MQKEKHLSLLHKSHIQHNAFNKHKNMNYISLHLIKQT